MNKDAYREGNIRAIHIRIYGFGACDTAMMMAGPIRVVEVEVEKDPSSSTSIEEEGSSLTPTGSWR